MKIEFTRAEVEAILLDHANRITGRNDPYSAESKNAKFSNVEPTGYRTMPDGFVVSTKEVEDAAQ